MSLELNYPGVYIRELESDVRPIIGVGTSVTAFIGRAKRGPVNKPMTIHSFSEYQRIFGGLWKPSNMSYAVSHYFSNGGRDAIIVRVHRNAQQSIYEQKGGGLFTLKSANPGEWGNHLEIEVDHEVDLELFEKDNTLFRLKVFDPSSGIKEIFSNLSTKSESSRFVKDVLAEEASTLVKVNEENTIPIIPQRPNKGNFTRQIPPSGNLDPDGDTLNDGDIWPTSPSEEKKGIFALDGIDIFNMLCIPPYNDKDNTSVDTYKDASNYCKTRRAILIVDPPTDWKTVTDAKKIDDPSSSYILTRNENAAIWFPRIKVPDPLNENKIRVFAPSGAIAGVIARTDAERGIWKAPAGLDASLFGVTDLTLRLTDEENGELNPLGINCLRIFPVAGRLVWGARTLKGADRLANQWKYLPVRRLALYIEESLYRGTQWAVFEPNDEPLWSQLRLNIKSFMHDLYLKGAFRGDSPDKAYLVKCDNETTLQADIDKGIVNIFVKFAPLIPAEFIVIHIQQLAGQREQQ